jgi:hypothetical protein
MVGKISNSAVYEPRLKSGSQGQDLVEERRPVAKNMRHVRPKPIPIDRASLAMELLNNQTRPMVNIVGTRHFHEDPTPLDKNYPLEIELQRLAMEAVPNKPQPPLKIKSTVTDDMIEKYREEERRGILQRGYNVPPELDVLDLQPEIELPTNTKIYEATMKSMDKDIVDTLVLYDKAKKDVDNVKRQMKVLDDDYNSLMGRTTPGERASLFDQYIKRRDILDRYLQTLQIDMRNLQEERNMIQSEMDQMKQEKSDLFAQALNIKRANAQKIKNAEDQIRLLNTTLPIGQMPGEPDEVYRQRLIALRVPVDNKRVDATEARVYEHKLFKRNLKKLIDLPLYQVENIIKTLDMNDAERTYQLNEIFPKVETEFIKQFGRKPLLRDPIQSLTDFFINLLEAPAQAQEQSEALSTIAEAEGVFSGEIDPSLRNLKKADVKKLIKDAGLIPKGEARKFERMTVKQLKVFYTQYLKRGEAFAFLSQRGQEAQEGIQARNKAQEEQMMRYMKEEEVMMREEDKQVRAAEKEYKREEKTQKKIGQKEEASFKKAQSFIQKKIAEGEKAQKEQLKQEAEYRRLIEAQRKQAEKEAQAPKKRVRPKS